MIDYEQLAEQVLAIDNTKNKADVIADLRYTKSVEATINRIFDGEFLKGTERDSSMNKTFIILDSDEEEEASAIKPLPSATTKPTPILLQDSSEADVLKSPELSTFHKTKYTSSDSLLDFEFDEPAFSIDNDKSQDNDLSVYPSAPDDESFDKAKKDKFSTLSIDDDLIVDDSISGKDHESAFSFEHDDSQHKEDDLINKTKHFGYADDIVTLPSTNDFFDELMSQKPDTPVFEIEDDDEPILIDKKGKGKERNKSSVASPRMWDDDDKPLTAKERKKLEAEERKRKRAEEAEEKKRAKAKLAEEKQRQKEQKEFEKQRNALFEKENRIRTDRTDILNEMIVDIHPEFLKTRSGQLVEALLLRKNAELRDLSLQQPDPKHTISWRRKCNSEWSNDSQTFIPLPSLKITSENVILVHILTDEFVQYIQDNSVEQYIDRIEEQNPKCQIMIMLEGLDTYYRKKKLSQRREFDAQVRNSIHAGSSQSRSKRKNDQDLSDAPEHAKVEECLNHLQFMRDIMFVPTKDEQDTASWVESLTVDLALSRYKSKNLNHNYKVIKSATDPQDMYFKMLQEIQLCTPAVAKSVIDTYPTVQSLYKAYENTSTSEGELLLANLNVERSALHVRDRKINRVMSKKIYTIFTCQDPDRVLY